MAQRTNLWRKFHPRVLSCFSSQNLPRYFFTTPISRIDENGPNFEKVWNWPANPEEHIKWGSLPSQVSTQEFRIPIKIGELLTVQEVVEALNHLNGENVISMDVSEKVDIFQYLIFVSGNSVRQMKRMADVIVEALKNRELDVYGADGAEDYESKNWILVDCGNILVQIMSPSAREALQLEDHWENHFGKMIDPSQELTEELLEELIQRFPMPETGYDVDVSDDDDKEERPEKQQKQKKKDKSGKKSDLISTQPASQPSTGCERN